MSDDGLDRRLAEGLAKTDAITPKNFVVLHSAGQGTGFFDLDNIISDHQYGEILIQEIVEDVQAMDCEFDKIAFLDKDFGPTGLITAATEISRELETDITIIKLWDTLRFDELKIKGTQLEDGDSVLILDDVITSGTTQERARKIIQGEGGEVVGMYSVLVRDLTNLRDIKKEEECDYWTTLDELQGAGLTHPESLEDVFREDMIEKYVNSLAGSGEAVDEDKLREAVSRDIENLLSDSNIEIDSVTKNELEDLYFHTITYLNENYA